MLPNTTPPTGTPTLADIGFNLSRSSGGLQLPNLIGNYKIITEVLAGINMSIEGAYGMLCSKTGIKVGGLSGGTATATDFNEVVFNMRNQTNAYLPPVPATNGCVPHYGGLCPRYWLEKGVVVGEKNVARTTHLVSCDVNSNTDNGVPPKARYMFGHRIICENPAQTGWVQAQTNDGSYDNPQYTDNGTPINLATLSVVGANPAGSTSFRYRMETPYAPSLWVCKDYNQATGSSTGGWELVYNWATGANAGVVGSTYACPSWFGDMPLVIYNPYDRFDLGLRGNFDLINSFVGENNSSGSAYEPFPQQVYNPSIFSREGVIKTGAGFFSGSVEALAADGYAEKEMYIVHNRTNNTTDLDRTLQIPLFPTNVFGAIEPQYAYPLDPTINKFFVIGTPQTNLGYDLGYGSEANVEITTGVPSPYSTYKAVALNNLQASKNVNSVHIQLTNLPIQSKNAMIQSGVKDIAVVPCYDAQKVSDDVANNLEIYHHQIGEKNWVDLNNIQSLYINNLDIYLTYDNNTPATGVKDETDVLVMFRQKPTHNTLLPLNVGTLPNQNPFQQTIQEI